MGEHDIPKPGHTDKMISEATANSQPIRPAPPRPPGMRPEIQAQIGQQLRAVYQAIVNEPVPERFLRLIEELERKKADRS